MIETLIYLASSNQNKEENTKNPPHSFSKVSSDQISNSSVPFFLVSSGDPELLRIERGEVK